MPAYNVQAYIEQAINSMLAQSYPHWELIVVNDGSTDQTAARVKAFADPRIKYIEQPNQGVSASRNKGLALMQGHFFCFLDADDALPTQSLAKRLQHFENPAIAFVDGTVELRDTQMQTVLKTHVPAFKGAPGPRLARLDQRVFVGITWMVRRQPNTTYAFSTQVTNGEDLLFLLSIAPQGQFTYTSATTYWYRRGHQSASQNLHGLNKGYQALLAYLKTSPWKSALPYTRIRLARIMFLSFLAAKNPLSAIKSALYFLLK